MITLTNGATINMYELGPPQECEVQLEALLADTRFQRMMNLVTKEVMRSWKAPHDVVRSFVLSAIGEPRTLGEIHRAWSSAKAGSGSHGLAMVMIRRSVIDLLRKDRQQPALRALTAAQDGSRVDRAYEQFDDLIRRDPHSLLEARQLVQKVREALSCFAAQGKAQQRQALLLRRYVLDEASYSDLSVELSRPENALRVSVHKAVLALRRHVLSCHPELHALLERNRLR